MIPETRQKIRNLLIDHESYKQFPCHRTDGCFYIGIGRDLSKRGISQTEALSLLDDDISYYSSKLSRHLPYFDNLDENRKAALIDMCFPMGIMGLLDCNSMLSALENKKYELASTYILDFLWANQEKERAIKLASIIKTGEI